MTTSRARIRSPLAMISRPTRPTTSPMTRPWRSPRAAGGTLRVALFASLLCSCHSPQAVTSQVTAPSASGQAPMAITAALASASATTATPTAPAHAVRRLFDGPCVELDDGQIVCSAEDDAQGCRFEPVRAGSVAPMGDSLCALSLSGQALTLHGLGCDWDAKAERFVPPMLKNEVFSCRHELDSSVSCSREGKPPRS